MVLFILFGAVLPILVGISLACYDSESRGCMGSVNRVFSKHIPNVFQKLLFLLPGGRFVHSGMAKMFDYCFNKPNPIIQVFYLILVLGGFSVFVWLGLRLIPNPRLGRIHLFLPFASLAIVLWSFFLASFRSPGVITARNAQALMQVYEFDGFLFPRGKVCSTCKTPKVARSKHCRMSNQCVAQFDHYCPWINNTVGALNFRYFIFFCSATTWLLFYGTYVFVNIVLFIIERDRLWEVEFTHSANPALKLKADWTILLQFLLAEHGPILLVLMLCIVMGVTLFAFTAYQFWMIKCGMTGNESAKWDNVHDFYASAKWKRELEMRASKEEKEETMRVTIDPLSDKEPSLDERMVKAFPEQIPRNIYNLGFKENLRRVLWPPVAAFEDGKEEEAVKEKEVTKPSSTSSKKKRH